MPRNLREIVPRGVYHITARGNNRQTVFRTPEDWVTYLRFVRSVKEAYCFDLFLYVLMENHIHLVLRTSADETQSVSEIMKSLSLRYTKYFNRRYSFSGNLFQHRFFSELLLTDAHLLELVRYVHLNPLRAQLVEILTEYPYSSHRCYYWAGRGGLVDCEELLSLFGEREATQVRRYRKFVDEGVSLWQLRLKSGVT